jgi:AdoMet-dependent rRNA methyltransferase SPB1
VSFISFRLQVAAEHTPLSSVIIGVDLVSIKPIRNVITVQADITTEKCRQLVHKELKGLKADCVLHDGAPNVGAAWVQDAFSQAMLCLKALKLASEFLSLNGFFITKVFRSRDYQPLVWVLQQLFKRVHATKPQASRSESAEIFVICQGYLAPDKIDPLLLDPKMIFKEVEVPKQPILFDQGNKKKKAEGYEEREETQFKSFKVSEFVTGGNFLEILSLASELEFDVDVLLKHPLTTQEIKECCKDIKVLGKREIKNILAWRDKMRKFLECQQDDETNGKEECLDSGDAGKVFISRYTLVCM